MRLGLTILLLVVFSVRAADLPYRFVFVVDTSESMDSRKPAVLRTIREIVGSGFENQARRGDALDIWTFSFNLHKDQFPAQTWDSSRAALLAEIAAQFLADENFFGRTRFRSISEEVNDWIARQENALLFFVTDGEDAVVGIPFSLEINEAIAPLRRKARAARRVFLVSLAITNGRVTAWNLNEGLGKPKLPALPEREPDLPPVTATTRLVEKQAPEEPKPEPPPPPPVTVDLPPGARMIAVEPPPAQSAEPEPIVAIEPVQPPVVELVQEDGASTASASLLKESPAVNPPAVEPALSPPPKVEQTREPLESNAPRAIVEKSLPESSDTHARAVETTNQAAGLPPVHTPPPSVALAEPIPRKPLFFAVGGGIFICLLIIGMFLRRSKGDGVSLITKSLNQK